MLKPLPINYYDFASLREDGCLYVDKTAYLLRMIQDRRKYVFLSRPRRFGKSLTLSTLEAMFQGRAKLFQGLAAEEWVQEQEAHPCPVVALDMCGTETGQTITAFNESLIDTLQLHAAAHGISLTKSLLPSVTQEFLFKLCAKKGKVVLLIDEYDVPLLDNISYPERVCDMRLALRSFYRTIKSCERYLRFVMITGISKFSKVGIFSGMNNLKDISMTEEYGALCGYTQEELERNFSGWVDRMAENKHCSSENIFELLKEYYDGFSFDGIHKVYNPWSVMNALDDMQLDNYWFKSGSPSFLSNYMRNHKSRQPDEFRGVNVTSDFADTHEIERSTPEAMLYQSGYLTIVNRDSETRLLTLDYPNKEVYDSMSQLYAETKLHVRKA